MIAAAAGVEARPLSPGRVAIDDPVFKGYLANVPAADWRGRHRAAIPEALRGSDFLARFQGTTDLATEIDPSRTYPVRAATEHAIEEHQRVQEFRALLADRREVDEETRARLGALMVASHASYSACGLGSDGTDRLVGLVREAGPERGLYGAKITGGGSGGTVAVLIARGRQPAVAAIADRYARETGHTSAVYAGSSDGARAFGARELVYQGAQLINGGHSS
jgi:L-arabinokinase